MYSNRLKQKASYYISRKVVALPDLTKASNPSRSSTMQRGRLQ